MNVLNYINIKGIIEIIHNDQWKFFKYYMSHKFMNYGNNFSMYILNVVCIKRIVCRKQQPVKTFLKF